jgi:hypothetical protein
MNSYTFVQRCRPCGDLRVCDVSNWLKLMMEAFNLSSLHDKNGKSISVDIEFLKGILQKGIDKKFPTIGATEQFFSIPPDKKNNATIRFEIHTGTSPEEIFIDTFDICIGSNIKIPNFEYFKDSILLIKPFEAYLLEFKNENDLCSYDKQENIPKFDKPAIIRGFHFIDELLTNSIGGKEHCLNAPAWKVEEFSNGILFQLADTLFDTQNLDHIHTQKKVMQYLNM